MEHLRAEPPRVSLKNLSINIFKCIFSNIFRNSLPFNQYICDFNHSILHMCWVSFSPSFGPTHIESGLLFHHISRSLQCIQTSTSTSRSIRPERTLITQFRHCCSLILLLNVFNLCAGVLLFR